MNNTLSKVITFAVGALVGSAVTWKYFKTKYDRIANEEIESVRAYYKSKNTMDSEAEMSEESEAGLKEKITARKKERKAERDAAKDICEKSGYAIYDDKEGDDDEMDKPYVIPPEEFGDDYKVESLNYYKDGVLADDSGNIVENVGDVVVEDFAEHFGEYENDSVFVRNDLLETDYEILMEYRTYAEVFGGR